MKQLLITILFFVLALVSASAQSRNTTRADKIEARRELKIANRSVKGISQAGTISGAGSHDSLVTQKGVKDYVTSLSFGTTLPQFRLAVGNSSNQLSSDPNLVYNATGLGIGTSSPAFGIDIALATGLRNSRAAADFTAASGVQYYHTGLNRFRGHNGTSFLNFLQTPVDAPVNGQIIRVNGDGYATMSERFVFRSDNLGVDEITSPTHFFDAQGTRAGVTGIQITNKSTSGYSGFRGNDTGGGERFFSGWGNASVSETWRASKGYIGTGDVDLAVSLNRSFPLLYLQHNATGSLQRVGFGTATPAASIDFALGPIMLHKASSDPAGASAMMYTRASDGAIRYHNGTSWGGIVRTSPGQILYGSNDGSDLQSSNGFTFTSSGLLVTPTVIGTGLQVRSSQAALVGIGPLTGQLNLEFGYASGVSNFFNDVLAGDAVIRGPASTSNRRLLLGIESAVGTGPSTMQIGLGTVGINLGTNTSTYPLDVRGNLTGDNVLSIRNTSASGYSTIIAFDNTGTTAFQVGYANASTGHPLINARNYFSGNNKDFVFSTNSASTALLFLQQSNQRIGIGNITTPTERLHVQDNIRATGRLILGSNQTQIIEGSGSPEGVVIAPPGSIYSNNSGTGDFAVYVKASGSGSTGWEPINIGSTRQLSATDDVTLTIDQSLFNNYKKIYIVANLTAGASNNMSITPPPPSASNRFRSMTIVCNDANATNNISLSSSSGLYYASSGTAAPSTQSSITLTGSSTSVVVAEFVCMEPTTGNFRWVLMSKSAISN